MKRFIVAMLFLMSAGIMLVSVLFWGRKNQSKRDLAQEDKYENEEKQSNSNSGVFFVSSKGNILSGKSISDEFTQQTSDEVEVFKFADLGGDPSPYIVEEREGHKTFNAPYSLLGLPATNGLLHKNGEVVLKGHKMRELLETSDKEDCFCVAVVKCVAKSENPAESGCFYKNNSHATYEFVTITKEELLKLQPPTGYAYEVYWDGMYRGLLNTSNSRQ